MLLTFCAQCLLLIALDHFHPWRHDFAARRQSGKELAGLGPFVECGGERSERLTESRRVLFLRPATPVSYGFAPNHAGGVNYVQRWLVIQAER